MPKFKRVTAADLKREWRALEEYLARQEAARRREDLLLRIEHGLEIGDFSMVTSGAFTRREIASVAAQYASRLPTPPKGMYCENRSYRRPPRRLPHRR